MFILTVFLCTFTIINSEASSYFTIIRSYPILRPQSESRVANAELPSQPIPNNRHQETEENAFVSKKGFSKPVLDEESAKNSWYPTTLLIMDKDYETADDDLKDEIIRELGVEDGFKNDLSPSGNFDGTQEKYNEVPDSDDPNVRERSVDSERLPRLYNKN